MHLKVVTQLRTTKLKATGAHLEVPDGGMTGLYAIVQPSGSKSFAIASGIVDSQRNSHWANTQKYRSCRPVIECESPWKALAMEKTLLDGQEAHFADFLLCRKRLASR